MGWQDEMYEEIAKYVGLPEGSKIVHMYDSTYSYGGCETCGPEYETTLEITYELNGESKYTSYGASFSDIMMHLTRT